MMPEYTEVEGIKLITQGDSVVNVFKRKGFFESKALNIWNEIADRNKGRYDRLMLDIGAYTGIYTISAAKRRANVIGFEPNPFSYRRALLNFTLNDVDAEIIELGLLDQNAVQEFYLPKGRELSSASTFLLRQGSVYRIVARTLDSFDFKNVYCIKIDVERTEEQVLKGALNTIYKYRPIIIIELLRDYLYERAMKVLEPYNYKVTSLGQALYLLEHEGSLRWHE